MSRSNSDDFFGIEVDSVYHEKNTPNKEKVEAAAKVTGTDFLEDALCPGLREKAEQFERARGLSVDEVNTYDDSAERLGHSSKTQGDILWPYEQNTKSPREPTIDDERFLPSTNSDEIQANNQRKSKRIKDEKSSALTNEMKIALYDDEALPGLDELWNNFLDLRNVNEDQLLSILSQTVIYADNNLIAFEKPYGLPYSGSRRNDALQFDRLLQRLKALVAPKVERLYLIKSLDKAQSGILLFGTSKMIQNDVKEMINSDLVEQKYRCIVRGALDESSVDVTIPLIRMIRNGDLKLQPLVSNKAKYPIEYVKSNVQEVNSTSFVSDVEVTVERDCPHQIRSHLSLIGCPLIGDHKYGSASGTMRYQSNILKLLNISKSQSKKLPMFCHFKEMNLPPLSGSNPIKISSPMPYHYRWMLKRLRLLKL
ncbi:unnamed protein product [Auanema sp. JU1783]|nr:unnamed protein product [Auanema sp. JU1783]